MVSYRTTRRIEFRDTDAAQIAHFTAFFNYMEEVEHEYLRHVGLSVMMEDSVGAISWPRVAATCQYLSAVRFEDVVDVEIELKRLGQKSVTWSFRFSHQKRDVAAGELTAVCCRIEPGQPPRSIAIPAGIALRLKQEAPA